MESYLSNQLDIELVFESDQQKEECMTIILAKKIWKQNEIDNLIQHTKALQNAKIHKIISPKDFLLSMRFLL